MMVAKMVDNKLSAEQEAVLRDNAALGRERDLLKPRGVFGAPTRGRNPVAEAIARLGGISSARAKRRAS